MPTIVQRSNATRLVHDTAQRRARAFSRARRCAARTSKRSHAPSQCDVTGVTARQPIYERSKNFLIGIGQVLHIHLDRLIDDARNRLAEEQAERAQPRVSSGSPCRANSRFDPWPLLTRRRKVSGQCAGMSQKKQQPQIAQIRNLPADGCRAACARQKDTGEPSGLRPLGSHTSAFICVICGRLFCVICGLRRDKPVRAGAPYTAFLVLATRSTARYLGSRASGTCAVRPASSVGCRAASLCNPAHVPRR